MELQQLTINGRKIIALPVVLEALTKVHTELVAQGIGYKDKLGFMLSDEITGGWRSLALQTQIVNRGASKTLMSNHRRGSAVDCAADWDYIGRIKATMNKYGLFNDLAFASKDWKHIDDSKDAQTPIPWDGGHWNFHSNAEATAFPLINEQALIKEFSMNDYNETFIQLTEQGVTDSGAFALVIGGKKRVVGKNRLAEALATYVMRDMKKAKLNKKDWDAIPLGDNF